MRLLNARTLHFKEFLDDKIPEYAILSHRWVDDEEVTFQDWQSGVPKEGAGLSKIEQCCARAIKDTLDWVWIDTCCIDKSSSAELTESINSMFRWYRQSKICYAYLADVHEVEILADGTRVETNTVNSVKNKDACSLNSSVWFKRGWTLQELLAPEEMIFFQDDWTPIGTKASLSTRLAEVTRISRAHLYRPFSASVAMKMSWASQRSTSRKEDEAYCLMGLFDVNMPLLYGEREKAFLRLQLEIIKSSTDESIFAWTSTDGKISSMLAPRLNYFSKSSDVVEHKALMRPSYWMTNKGLEFPVPSSQVRSTPAGPLQPRIHSDSSIPLTLNCRRKHESKAVVIRLGRLPNSREIWARKDCGSLAAAKSGMKEHTSLWGIYDMARISVVHPRNGHILFGEDA